MSRRARLLVLASTYPGRPGDGTPGFVRDLALEQARHFDTLVVVPRVPGGASREDDGPLQVRRFAYFPRRWESLAHGAILENLRARRSRYLQVLPLVVAEAIAVRRAVRRFRPDVVHVHWIIPQGLVARAVLGRTPMVVTTLGGDLYALDSPPLRAVKGTVLRRARAVTVMSEDMRSRAVGLGADPDAVSVLPMGVDGEAFSGPRDDSREASARLLFVGRLVEKKGLEVLLRALRSVRAGWTLTVVGDGPLRAGLEKEAQGLPVTFVGQLGRPELAAAYASHGLVVVPSVHAASGDQDGLPVAMLEAMAAGCAVVASDMPGLREAIEDRVSGLLVPPGDSDALAGILGRLLEDPEEGRRLGTAARARADLFSVRRRGEQYVELLRRVAGRD